MAINLQKQFKSISKKSSSKNVSQKMIKLPENLIKEIRVKLMNYGEINGDWDLFDRIDNYICFGDENYKL